LPSREAVTENLERQLTATLSVAKFMNRVLIGEGAFDPRAIPEPTRLERFQRFFGITHERHAGSFRLAKTGDRITVSEHVIVVELFWYRVALLVAPVLWLVAAIGLCASGDTTDRLPV
jgi:hypothetical protein